MLKLLAVALVLLAAGTQATAQSLLDCEFGFGSAKADAAKLTPEARKALRDALLACSRYARHDAAEVECGDKIDVFEIDFGSKYKATSLLLQAWKNFVGSERLIAELNRRDGRDHVPEVPSKSSRLSACLQEAYQSTGPSN